MGTRRSLTDSDKPSADIHATRRGTGGARRETADRVLLQRGATALNGWALNVSRGGVRLILEGRVELGEVYAVKLGEDSSTREGRVVWVQEEADGTVVGIEFSDAASSSSAPPGPIGKRE